jgi:hypothetical protein
MNNFNRITIIYVIASTIHTMFQILTHGYFFLFLEPHTIITKLNNTIITIIDEISMMTSNMMCYTTTFETKNEY